MAPQLSLDTLLRTAPPSQSVRQSPDYGSAGSFQSYLDSLSDSSNPSGDQQPSAAALPPPPPQDHGPQAITDDDPQPPVPNPTGAKPRLTKASAPPSPGPPKDGRTTPPNPSFVNVATAGANVQPSATPVNGATPRAGSGQAILAKAPVAAPQPDVTTAVAPVISGLTDSGNQGSGGKIALANGIPQAAQSDPTANELGTAASVVSPAVLEQSELSSQQSEPQTLQPQTPKRSSERAGSSASVPQNSEAEPLESANLSVPVQPDQGSRPPVSQGQFGQASSRAAAASAPDKGRGILPDSQRAATPPLETAGTESLPASGANNKAAPAQNQSPGIEKHQSESVTAIKTATVQTGQGDSAAANVGRFLIQPDDALVSTGAASPSNAAPATHGASLSPSASHVPASTTPVAVSNSTVADLLSPPTDGMNRIEQAANILTAARSTGADRHQATLQLDPPELGQIRIDIRLHDEGMSMRVDAQSAATAKLVESRLPELRDALAIHGIRVNESQVVVRSPESGDAGAHSNFQRSDGGTNEQQPSWFAGGQSSGSPRDREAWSSQPQAGSPVPDSDPVMIPFTRPGEISDRYVNLVA